MTLLEQGQKLLSEKKYDDALKCFDGVLKGDPGNVEALLGKIAVFRETQNFSQANELLDEVLEGDPGNAEALQGKVAILREKHEFRQANELLRDALTRHPNHAGILSEQAWLLLAQKKYDEAIDAFSKVLQIRPDLGIYMWKAALLRGRRRFDEAERTLDEANEHFNHVPQIARIQSERGWLHFYRKRYDEALAVFTSVVTNARYALADQESALQGEIASLRMKGLYADAMRSADKSLKMMSVSPGIHSERGWIHFDQADYESAEKDFQVVLDLAPNDVSSHTNLALSLVRQGGGTELHRATEHFRIALQYDPNSAEALGGLGTIAFKQRRVREAETYFRRSIEADPEKGLYADLAALYIQMGRYDEARKELEEGVRRNPDDAIVHIELGNLHLQNSESKEATREFRSATMLDPYNPRPIIGLAVTLMESNKLSEAETVLRRGIRFLDKSKRWELHLTLCRLLTHIGDDTGDHQYYSEALEEVSTAIRLKPEHSAPYFHGGIILFRLEDYRGALRYFRRCRPEDEYCREAKLNEKRVRVHLHRERSRVSRVASLSLAVICLLQLVGLWIALLRTPSKVSTTMLTVLIPILLGLIVVAVLLPWLSRLKMTGLEAELNAPGPKESLASGPRGEIGFGSAFPKSF